MSTQQHSHLQPLLGHQGSRSHRACTACRQAKLRCDNVEAFPAACTRCRAKGFRCRTDPHFKRTSTRRRLDDVTAQLAALQKTLDLQSPNSNPQSAPDTSSVSEDTVLIEAQEVHFGELVVEDKFYRASSAGDLPNPDASLGDITLNNDQVAALFEHFGRFYYRHCPILSCDMSVRTLYDLYPFLFWTIVTISSRWHPELSDIYPKIISSYQSLVEKTLMGRILALEPVQAGVLLCYWPLAVEKQSYDPSWNYCGLITNAAIKIGLHKGVIRLPQTLIENDSRSQLKTWLACFFINCSHGWHTGIPVPTEMWSGLRVLVGPRTLAEEEFVKKVSVMKQYARSRSILESMGRNSDYNIVQMLCKELDNMRDEQQEIWSPDTEIILLGVQLSIYTHQLEHALPHNTSRFDKASRYEQESTNDILVNVAFGLAVRLIDAFHSITVTDPNSATPQRYLPKHYFNMLLVASAVIVKARTKSPSATAHASAMAQNQLRHSYTILSAWSAREHDEPDRAARLIGVLSRAERQGGLKLTESCKDSRTGIAVISDVIMTAKELRESAGTSSLARMKESGVSDRDTAGDMQVHMEGEPGLGPQLDSYDSEFPLDQWVQELLLDWDLGRHYGFQMDAEADGIFFL
ncbi:hypothetical protein BU16DRAFT_524023 [Lophium mytilinum]|uniref:Zn(2)-C6 fungal-type domain-containing protein n=1 Tax=Lophium mytilinum TaxID=390894 RepID=A0A6A6R4Z6_9PEZI|nr:hypothetical protein BU16DRAFT_524023 [Lophium mytilinum]